MFEQGYIFQLIFDNYLVFLFAILIFIYNLVYSKASERGWSKSNWSEKVANIVEDEELSRTFQKGWTVVLESSELLHNQIRPLSKFGKDLVIYRGHSNKCYVFDAYCAHLGANLGVGGTIIGESVQCPFHGWVFDQSGQCTHVPGLEVPINVRLINYPVLEIMGFICVWYDPEKKEPSWFPQDYYGIESKGLRFKGKSLNVIHANPIEILQHFADFNHYTMLHSDHKMWYNWPKDGLIYKWFHKIIQITFAGCKWDIGEESERHTFLHSMTTQVKMFWCLEITFHNEVYCMGPSLYTMKTKFNFFGERQILSAVGIMHDQDRLCRAICRVYSKQGIINSFWAKHFTDSSYKMMKGEAEILSSTKYLSHPLFTINDKTIEEYRHWFQQFNM